jgi:hypothetical protein
MALRQAVSDAKLWEMRFQATEKSRETYRESGRRLIQENEQLQSAISQTEKDTVKVIGFLKKEGGQKEEQVSLLQGELEEEMEKTAREKKEMDSQFRSTATEMEEQLQERTEELAVIQGELRTVEEFRKRRAELEAELARLKQGLTDSEQDQQRTLQALEERFFEEKVRLQKEANRRIAELSEKAHREAVRNLGERTREVYRENLQMNEALALHAARVQELETRTERLEAANRSGRIDRLVLKFMFTIIMHCYIPVGSITGPSYVLRTQGIGSGERSQWETTGLTSTECETVPAANLSTSGKGVFTGG